MSTEFSRRLWVMCWCCGVGVAAVTSAAGQDAAGKGAASAPRGRDDVAVPGAPESASPGRTGVAPTRSPRPRSGALPRGKVEAVVTFPGFRLLPDGRSTIFVELTRAVSVVERRTPTRLIYTLRGASVPVLNNRHPLVTTHFATAVDRARLVRTPTGVELVIDLRTPVAPAHQMVTTDQGSARLEVEFPAGNYAVKPTAVPGSEGAQQGSSDGASEQEPPPSSHDSSAP